MKQFTHPGWLNAILIESLSHTAVFSYARASEMFCSSIYFYMLGRYSTKDLN